MILYNVYNRDHWIILADADSYERIKSSQAISKKNNMQKEYAHGCLMMLDGHAG